MIDYSQVQTASATPEANSMLETMRAIGYSLESAVADIVDNSISAGAANIWIDYEWKGLNTTISIIDDGNGMNNDELINALRPGSRNPLDLREAFDLGRFGMGLKTASFSQCRKFAVVSRKETTDPSYWCWDLDYVNYSNSWNLIKYCPSDTFIRRVAELKSGTAVIWWGLDKLTDATGADDAQGLNVFLTALQSVKKHISMVFHRYISEGLKIHVNGRKTEGWDPFMIGFKGLQPKPESRLDKGAILIKGFVLPHRSKLSSEEYNNGGGPKGSWTAHQGFYVYRNKRLLVSGDWLGFFKREVHYDLCRIQIDLPNSADAEWQIDIKKSVARPPARLKEQILAIAKDTRDSAAEVYRHRGKVIKRSLVAFEFKPMWKEMRRHGKRFYEINREHPIISELLENENGSRRQIEKALSYIEETVPVPLIVLKESENQAPHCKPFEDLNHEVIVRDIKKLYSTLREKGNSDNQAKGVISRIEPYDLYPELIETIDRV